MHNLIRVAAATPKTRPADCGLNAREMVRQIREAAATDAQVIVFPELSLTGYTCGDLFYQSALVDASLAALRSMLEETKDADMLIAVGLPLRVGNAVFNCAAVLYKGEILGIVPKTYLPNSAEFYEKRVFAPAESLFNDSVDLFGKRVPVGADLLFSCEGIPGGIIGVEICQDIWHVIPPSIYMAHKGATLILNLSASPELIGKASVRRNLIKTHSAMTYTAYVYVSSGMGESVSDVVYGGHNIICENGRVLAEKPPLEDESHITYADVDLEIIVNTRRANSGFNDGLKKTPYRTVPFALAEKDRKPPLLRRVNKNPFLPESRDERAECCAQIFAIQTCGLARRLEYAGAKKAVINVSGGLDSTLGLLVAAAAEDRLSRDRKDVLGLTLPGFGTSGRTLRNALALMEALGVSVREINIRESCLLHFRDIGLDAESAEKSVAYENAQSRERTQIAMDIANMEGGFMVGTGDMSELALGWCTYGGDHMSMYNPNAGVTKTAVAEVIRWAAETEQLGAAAAETLFDILRTPISPELLPTDKDGRVTQLTEDRIGPYELHDFFLFHMLKNGFAPDKIAYLASVAFEGAYTEPVIEKWLEVFLKRFFTQQYKRSCLPEGPKVFDFSLSPRGDLRMPGDVAWDMWPRSSD